MIVYADKIVVKNIQIAKTCDCCKKTFDAEIDFIEFDNFSSVFVEEGYGSIFGDNNKLRTADFCQRCAKALFGKYLRVFDLSKDIKNR